MDDHPKPLFLLPRPPPCSIPLAHRQPVPPADYVLAMGVDELKAIATELATRVRKSVNIHWMVRESARVKIALMVRRIVRKHGLSAEPSGRGHQAGAGTGGSVVC